MEFFVAWYYGDPIYPIVDNECCMLISPPNIPKKWTVNNFNPKPVNVMIDSGAYRHMDEKGLRVSQKEAFDRQVDILGDFRPAILCHLDFPIPRKDISKEKKQRRVEITINNANTFYDLFLNSFDSEDKVQPLGVIQGFDEASISHCCTELKKMGFSIFGVGSVARLSRLNRKVIANRVIQISKMVNPIHVFGVSSILLMKMLSQIPEVISIDSTTPIKEAIYSGIIYSEPLRRFKISTPHFEKKWSKKYGYAKILTKPLSCDCPICREFGPKVLFKRGKKKFNNLRALHNYYHLKREIIRSNLCKETFKII